VGLNAGVTRSVFLYYHATDAVDRDEIEAIVEEALAQRGLVTGAGSGLGLVNLDLEITDADPEGALRNVDRALVPLSLPNAFWQWEHDAAKIPLGSA
jgi:hypothetical protein